MKILYAITKSNLGGAQKYVHDLAIHFSKETDVVVAFGGTGPYGTKPGFLSEKLESGGIQTIFLKNSGRDIAIIKDIFLLLELYKVIKKENPDVVHLNSSKIGGIGALAARFCGVKKIVFTVHGWAFKENRGWMSILLIKIASWLTVALSHTTITISEYDLNQASWMPLVKKKIIVIYNGLSDIRFLDRKRSRELLSSKMENTPDPDSIWIGTIAELHPNKGLGFGIRAIDKIIENGENVFYTIIGEGEERNILEKLITLRGLQDNVALVGKITDASSYLSAFDMFLLPSIKEGLPYVIIEAGLAGLPIIATKVGGVGEMIIDMQNGVLVEPQNSDSLYGAISSMIKRKDRKQMGISLRENILEKFSLEKMTEKLLSVYRSAQIREKDKH